MAINKEILSTLVVKEFQRLILTGKYKVGDQLPSHEELADYFGVSRTVVREALKQLSLMGIIKIEHGKGTFVNELEPGSLLEYLSPILLMDRASVSEFIEARLNIEPMVAYLAAKRRERKDLTDLEELNRSMEEDLAEGRLEVFLRKDLDFHIFIARAAKNRVLARIVQMIRDILQQLIGERFTDKKNLHKPILAQNKEIIRHINNRDADKARDSMEKHIRFIQRNLLKNK